MIRYSLFFGGQLHIVTITLCKIIVKSFYAPIAMPFEIHIDKMIEHIEENFGIRVTEIIKQ